jgi:hypothetical protein
MGEAKRNKKLGFIPKTSKTSEKKELIKEPKGRLISWSPWPPAFLHYSYSLSLRLHFYKLSFATYINSLTHYAKGTPVF